MANKSWTRQLWCSLGVQIVAIVLAATCALAISVTLPQTGQITCFDSSGTEINCAGTGQDGEHRAGVEWPASRFIDNGNGTLTDNLTGLIWLKNANCAGELYWNDALSWSNSLASGTCGLTDGSSAGEWRLPNILELESLVNVDHGNVSCGGTPCGSPSAWLASQGFVNMGYGYYFSSSTAIQDGHRADAWTVDMDDYGNLIHGSKTSNYFALAVKGTSVGPAQVWRTGQTACYDSSGSLIACAGTGQDADIQAGAVWPDPRFTDNSDGTVTDNLTGLIWLKNANCAAASQDWQSALDDVAGLNASGMMNGNNCSDISQAGGHQSDWRLPNYKELLSLIDFSRYNPALLSSSPFLNLVPYGDFWSSTTFIRYLPGAWEIAMWDGYTNYNSKSSISNYVWPVRGGTLPPTFAGGDGTLDDPYKVETAEQLNAVRNYLDKHFILIADINLDVAPFNTAEGWQPIGVPGAPFTGSLDGKDHTITKLFINRPDQDHVGLFGDASGATFANMTLEVEVTGDHSVGGLVGNLEPGLINGVHVTGMVTGTTNVVGGLAGRIKYADILSSSAKVPVAGGSPTSGGGSDLGGLVGNVQNGSSIADCAAYGSISVNSVSSLRTGGLLGTLWESSLVRSFATGDVVGRDNVGGLVGQNGKSSIANSFATGKVTATANGITNYGGLVGSSDSGSTITNSFATGNVNGIAMVGGLIGRQTADSSVTNSYATGHVTGTSYVGGLIGINYDGGVTSSYYDSTTTGQSDTGKGELRTTVQLRQQSNFADWNFTEVWKIVEGGNYPYLAWQTFATVVPMLNAPVNDGTVADLRPTLAWLPTLTLEGKGVVGYEIQLSTNSNFPAEATESWMVWTGEPLFTNFGFAALMLLCGPVFYRNFRHKIVLLSMVGLLAAVLMGGCGNSSHSKLVVEQNNNIVTHSLATDLASGTNYFWRVRAVDDQGEWSDWSPVWGFITPQGDR